MLNILNFSNIIETRAIITKKLKTSLKKIKSKEIWTIIKFALFLIEVTCAIKT